MEDKICGKPCWGHQCKRVCVLLNKNHGGHHVCGGHYKCHEGAMTQHHLNALQRELAYYRQHGQHRLIKLVEKNIKKVEEEEE